jgi:hypothetical protein
MKERSVKRSRIHEPVAAGATISKASLLPAVPLSRGMARFGLAFLTFLLVSITWVFFRAPDFGSAMRLLLAMFGVIPVRILFLQTIDIVKVLLLTSCLLGFHWAMRDRSIAKVVDRLPAWALGIVWAAMLIVLVLTQKSTGSFIYFQF